MPYLFICEDAENDLEELWELAPKVAARITVLLEELKGNQDLLDRLTQHDFGYSGTADFHVSRWYEHWNKGKDLYRLKVWELEELGAKLRYRIVYAFLPRKNHYHVLAVVPREFNYESNSPYTIRILKSYEELI